MFNMFRVLVRSRLLLTYLDTERNRLQKVPEVEELKSYKLPLILNSKVQNFCPSFVNSELSADL